MTQERFTERKRELSKAVGRLLEVLQLPKNDIARDALIQRFEFTVELVWKTLKLYLDRQGVESGAPRQILKKAFAEGLIPSAEEADIWFQILEDRNLTSHTYREELAEAIEGRIRATYAERIRKLAEKISALSWD